jgi:hypothetical protein
MSRRRPRRIGYPRPEVAVRRDPSPLLAGEKFRPANFPGAPEGASEMGL